MKLVCKIVCLALLMNTLPGIGQERVFYKTAEVHILDAGHFALDEQAGEVIRLTAAFMQKLRETGIK